MHEVIFHYETGKQLRFTMNDSEKAYLESLLLGDGPHWFVLGEEAINLDRVMMVASA